MSSNKDSFDSQIQIFSLSNPHGIYALAESLIIEKKRKINRLSLVEGKVQLRKRNNSSDKLLMERGNLVLGIQRVIGLNKPNSLDPLAMFLAEYGEESKQEERKEKYREENKEKQVVEEQKRQLQEIEEEDVSDGSNQSRGSSLSGITDNNVSETEFSQKSNEELKQPSPDEIRQIFARNNLKAKEPPQNFKNCAERKIDSVKLWKVENKN